MRYVDAGIKPPIHCMWCGKDLNAEEIKDCLDRGGRIASIVLEKQGLHDLIKPKGVE